MAFSNFGTWYNGNTTITCIRVCCKRATTFSKLEKSGSCPFSSSHPVRSIFLPLKGNTVRGLGLLLNKCGLHLGTIAACFCMVDALLLFNRHCRYAKWKQNCCTTKQQHCYMYNSIWTRNLSSHTTCTSHNGSSSRTLHKQPCDRDGFHNRVILTFSPLGQCMPSNCYRVYVYEVWSWQLIFLLQHGQSHTHTHTHKLTETTHCHISCIGYAGVG